MAIATTIGSLIVGSILAADLCRTATMLVPLLAAGAIAWKRTHPETAPSILVLVAFANLLLPADHVVYNNIDLINPLPIKLYRILR